MEQLLDKLPDGIAVIAVIVVVILFLKHQRAQSKDFKEALQLIMRDHLEAERELADGLKEMAQATLSCEKVIIQLAERFDSRRPA